MLEQIKDLCLFMICGQTLLYFQSGKKYEKICRMILELLMLAGIVGMILNFLQSLGFRKGEMEAAGGAVAGMQRNMEDALSKQLGVDGFENDFLAEDMMESLIDKHTSEEIKTRYHYFAGRYGFEIQEVKKQDDKLQVFLKKTAEEGDTTKEKEEETQSAESSVEIAGIERIEIGEITLKNEEESVTDRKEAETSAIDIKEELETFRRQFALLLVMEEEKLEVILLD